MGTRTRRRTPLRVLAVSACALALAAAGGCGGDDEDDGGGGDAAGELTQQPATTSGGDASGGSAEAALESFFSALVEGDAAAACGLLSEQGLRYVEEGALTSSPSGGGECEDVVVDSYGSPDAGLLDGFEIVDKQFNTDGTQRLTFRNGATPITAAKSAVLRKEAGEWKVDSAGVLGS